MQFYTFGGVDKIAIDLFYPEEIEGEKYSKVFNVRQAGGPSQNVSALYDIIFNLTIIPIYFLSFYAQVRYVRSNNDFEEVERKRVFIPMIGCTFSITITTLVLLSIQVNYFFVILTLKNIWLCIWAFLV
jgi:hypothetical protein